MKRLQAICLVLLLVKFSVAQTMDDKLKFKEISGCYGSTTEGICLFEDGRFLLYGYATAVFGKYSFEKDYMKFVPDVPPFFEVYGTANKNIGDNTRTNFKGFDRGGNTFIKFGDNDITRVFNTDANCFDSPFVYQTTKLKGKTILSSYLEGNFPSPGKIGFSWEYELPKTFNDFIFIYNAPSRYEEEFEAIIEQTKEGDILRTSNYARENGFAKRAVDPEDKSWAEILSFKKQYDSNKATKADVIYANKHYSAFPAPNEDHIFDDRANQFVSKMANENEAYYLNNQYNDGLYLRKYVKIDPKFKTAFNPNSVKISPTTIFYTVCGEGSENSYHYNGYTKIENDKISTVEVAPMLQTIPNVVVDKPVKNMLNDGFYLTKDGIVSSVPLFKQSDIKSITDTKVKGELSIMLTDSGMGKLKQRDATSANKILLMLDGKRIAEANFKITDKSIQFSGNFTVEEIQLIINQLKK
ncbi:hypothetical protein [Pedobacter namyangjuensis]|uniref:hypothetical protein n=1 Tax=Pedobacter namyangjuensis TaxID=600626 RepID=UPI000DE4B562|nr:hypothetical protein [Pedobacter namyangjuensis]